MWVSGPRLITEGEVKYQRFPGTDETHKKSWKMKESCSENRRGKGIPGTTKGMIRMYDRQGRLGGFRDLQVCWFGPRPRKHVMWEDKGVGRGAQHIRKGSGLRARGLPACNVHVPVGLFR